MNWDAEAVEHRDLSGAVVRATPLDPECAEEGSAFAVACRWPHNYSAYDPQTLERIAHNTAHTPANVIAIDRGETISVDLDPAWTTPDLHTASHFYATAPDGTTHDDLRLQGWRVAHAGLQAYVVVGADLTAVSLTRRAVTWRAPVARVEELFASPGFVVATHDDGFTVFGADDGRTIARVASKHVSRAVVRWPRIYYLEHESTRDEDSVTNSHLVSRDLTTGKSWTFSHDLDRGVLELGAHTVFVEGMEGRVYALDAGTGDVGWFAFVGKKLVDLTPLDGDVLLVQDTGIAQLYDPTYVGSPVRALHVVGKYSDVRRERPPKLTPVRIWIADRLVRTDAHGRFSATVHTRSGVTVQIDHRDLPWGHHRIVEAWGLPDESIELDNGTFEDCH